MSVLQTTPIHPGYSTCRGNSSQLLVRVISFFWSLPKAPDQKWLLKRRLTGKLKGFPFGSAPFYHNSPVHYTGITSDAALPVHLTLRFSVNKTPRYFDWIFSNETLKSAPTGAFPGQMEQIVPSILILPHGVVPVGSIDLQREDSGRLPKQIP